MSATVREALAACASTVDGLTGHPYYVQTTDTGAVLVDLDRVEYPNRFGGVAHWNLVLLLPQDYGEAERYAETYGPLLRGAIKRDHLLVVTSMTLGRTDFPGTAVRPTLTITGHREED